MDLWSELPKLAEAPLVALLAIVILALAWTLTRVLAFLPRVPEVIVDSMSQAGDRSMASFRQAMDDLQAAVRDLQRDLHEEQLRLDEANAEILGMKRHLLSIDQDRRQAAQERDDWRDRSGEMEPLVKSLKAQVDQLSDRVCELSGRLAG